MLLLTAGAWDRLGHSLFFATLSLLALAALLLSLLFGGHDEADHDVDHDVDHDTDHDADHDADGGDPGNLNPLSTKVLLGFAFGWGFGGFVGSRFDLDWGGCNLAGLLGALIFGAIVYSLMNALYRRQGNSLVNMASLEGKRAVVDIGITPQGVGRITIELSSGIELYRARSADGVDIPAGTIVTIVSVAGGETVVRKAV